MNDDLKIIAKLKGKTIRDKIDYWWIDDYRGFQVVRGYTEDDEQELTPIRTSPIVALHENETIVETQNSFYYLGVKGREEGERRFFYENSY